MFERYFKGVQPHINIEKIESEIAFLPGPPERASAIAKKFSHGEKVTEKREFVTYRGEINEKNVCVMSTGIGCPSAAIAVEELANCGVHTFIRVGTTGAIQEDIELGDVIIPVATVRDDGTTKEYIGAGYPISASSKVTNSLVKTAEELKIKYHKGMVRTNDAFYGGYGFENIVRRYEREGILSFEMECAAIFTVAKIRELKAGAVLGVVGNIVKDEHAYKDPEKEPLAYEYKKKAEEAIDNAIKVAIDAVKHISRNG